LHIVAVVLALLHFPFDPVRCAIAEASDVRHAVDAEAFAQR